MVRKHEKGWQLYPMIKRSHKDVKLNILNFKLDWLEMTWIKERSQPKIYRLILVRIKSCHWDTLYPLRALYFPYL